MTLDSKIAERLKRNADGLFTAVVQERATGQVLMVAWMDDDALADRHVFAELCVGGDHLDLGAPARAGRVK